jgi:hypothetical protein
MGVASTRLSRARAVEIRSVSGPGEAKNLQLLQRLDWGFFASPAERPGRRVESSGTADHSVPGIGCIARDIQDIVAEPSQIRAVTDDKGG